MQVKPLGNHPASLSLGTPPNLRGEFRQTRGTNQMRIATTLVIVSMLASAAPLIAHHSFAAEFDGTKAIRLAGSLTKIEWTNPHTYFYIEVKDAAGNVA